MTDVVDLVNLQVLFPKQDFLGNKQKNIAYYINTINELFVWSIKFLKPLRNQGE